MFYLLTPKLPDFVLNKGLQLTPTNAYEVKKKIFAAYFERLFKVKKTGVFLFGISFFVLQIFTFFHYANEESDDVINRST